MSSTGSFLYQADKYAWSEDPFALRKAALTPEEIEALRKAMEKAAPVVAPKPVPVDPEALRQRDEAKKLRADAMKRLKEAEAKAAEMLAWAEGQAKEKQKQAAQQGYQEGLSQGTAAGYEQGMKQGNDEGLRRWVELVARYQSILQGTLDEKASYLADRETLMVQIAIETAAKILGRELKTDSGIVLTQVRQAIARTIDRSRLLVHLNPADIAAARNADEASFKLVDGIKNLEFVADDKVMAGGAYVETDSGTIDARLETQLAELAKSLLEAARHAD